MAISNNTISVNIDLYKKNCSGDIHVMQGNTNIIFEISLLTNGTKQILDGTETITAVAIYKPRLDENNILINSGSYVVKKGDAAYNITIKDSKIVLPLDINFTNSSDLTRLILKIESGNTVYTYSMDYIVDLNEAYSPTSLPDNLPKFKDLQTIIDNLKIDNVQNKQDISQNKNDITQAKTDIGNIKSKDATQDNDITQAKNNIQQININLDTKVNRDLSNLGDLSTANDGDIVYKKDGTLKHANINIDDVRKIITTPYSFQSAPQTFWLGTNLALTQNGGFLEDFSKATGKYYLVLDYENDRDNGSSRPIAYTRGAKQARSIIKALDNVAMSNVTVLNIGAGTADHQTQRIYFKLLNTVTNLKIKININGNDVMDYPYNGWNDNKAIGFNLGVNEQFIDLDPFWTTLKEYDIKLYIKADQAINMLGDGTTPWYALDFNVITREPVAYMSDIPATETGKTIVQKLQTLPVQDQLSAKFIKDLQADKTIIEILREAEALPNADKLDYITGLKNQPFTPTIIDKFANLTDIAKPLIANKLVVVNPAGDGLAYADMPQVSDGNETIFRQSLGIKCFNLASTTIAANTWVKIKADNNRFVVETITRANGYSNELIGITQAEIAANTEGNVLLITTLKTQTTVIVNNKAYIGFKFIRITEEIAIDVNTALSSVFGECGEFGNKDADGNYFVLFNAFKLFISNSSGSGATTFTALTDTPTNYTGAANRVVAVKSDSSGLEFITKPEFPTAAQVATGLNSLVGDARVDASAVKNLPAGVDISGKADLDLTNVSNINMLKKGAEAGLLQQDLASVDLTKLAEKVTDSKVLDDVNAEIGRLKTDISASLLPTFSYRGTKVPDYKGLQYKAYYINITGLSDDLMTFNVPAGDALGTIFTLRNADKDNDLTLTVPFGTTLNGKSDPYKIDESEIYMMVKNSATNWITIYNGLLPNSVKNLMDIVKASLPGQLNTIAEIQAQLKDRLHLFNEIQAEFNDELHSFDAIEANMITRGFSKGFSVGYGMIDTKEPSQSLNWVSAFIAPNAEVIIPATNEGIKYLAINMPVYLAALVSTIEVNQQAQKFTERKVIYNELDYTVFVMDNQLNTAVSNRLNIEFHNQSAIGKINIADYYAQIGTEFATKLHTYDDLEQNRFLRDWIAYGTSNNASVPTEGDNSWIFSHMRLAGTGQITKLLQPPAYIVVKVPKMYDLLITEARLNGSLNLFNRTEHTESNGASYVYYVSKNVSEISNVSITFDLFSNVPVQPQTLSVGNDTQTFPSITDIDFINADVTQQPTELNKVTVVPYISVEGTNDSIDKIKKIKFVNSTVDLSSTDANTAEITPQIKIMQNSGQEKLINSLEVEYPLRFTFNEPEQRGEISVENVFDFSKPEGLFLKGRAITYLKNFDGAAYNADIEHFTKEVYEGNDLALTGDEIQIKRPIGIYNGFPKAPLICYGRMAFEGFAPKAGFIEIGLRDVTTKKTLLGSYGETISRTRSYLANEKLYYLDFFSVFEVDYDIKNVEIYIKHSFGQDYDLKVSDDVDGGTCLMLQFVSQDYKTGEALQEVRNQYNLVLPFEIFELVAGQPLAGYSLELNGVIPKTGVTGVFNRQGFCEIGTAGKEAFFEMASTGLNITSKDDSTPSYAYIALMLNTELTNVFKNDNLILTVNLTLKDVFSALDIIPITWAGIANEIPRGIVGSVPDNFIPVPTDPNWTFDNANAHFIQMDLSDFNPRTISVDFSVPQNAVNFGVLVVPHAVANAMKMHVQGLNFTPKVTDVAPMLKPIIRLGDSYLFSSVRHGQYTWDFPPTTSTDKIQGLVLGTNPTQIPISKRVYGDAAIKLIKINGFNYHVMEFASTGKAKIDSTWTLTRPKSHFVHPSHTAKVYFAVATDNGSGGYNLSKITQSETTRSIDVEFPTVIQVTTPTFTYDVSPGTILLAMGTCTSADDVYVAMSHGGDRPIIVDVEYTESVTGTSSDSPLGSLYTEDALGGVWEIKTAADGHVESLKVGDLEENTIHHITRDNLNLNDFKINDGVVSISDIIVDRIEHLEKTTNEIEFVKNGIPELDQTKYKLQIDVMTGQTKLKEV